MAIEPSDPEASAEEAGLRYISDAVPGVRRRRAGRGFTYLDADGTRIADDRRLEWIRGLAIPPAWTEVWICPVRTRPSPGDRTRRARPQAVPLPPALARGPRRGEVRPHAREFARALPRIRAPRRARPASPTGSPREKVLAAVVAAARDDPDPGRQRGVRARATARYGLTTLRDRHVDGRRRRAALHVPRQERQEHEVARRAIGASRASCSAARTCRARSCSSTSTRTGSAAPVDSDDVNDYLREISGRGRSPPRTSGPGPAPSPRRWPSQGCSRSTTRRDDERRWCGPSRRSPSSSGTPRRCAAPATSIRRSSTPTSTEPSSTPSASVPAARDEVPMPSAPKRRRCWVCCRRGLLGKHLGGPPPEPPRRGCAHGRALIQRTPGEQLAGSLLAGAWSGGVVEALECATVVLVRGLHAHRESKMATRRSNVAEASAREAEAEVGVVREGPPRRSRRSGPPRARGSPWIEVRLPEGLEDGGALPGSRTSARSRSTADAPKCCSASMRDPRWNSS